jgi:hypothetical protein
MSRNQIGEFFVMTFIRHQKNYFFVWKNSLRGFDGRHDVGVAGYQNRRVAFVETEDFK